MEVNVIKKEVEMATTERARITGFFVIGFLVGLISMWALVKSGTWKISADTEGSLYISSHNLLTLSLISRQADGLIYDRREEVEIDVINGSLGTSIKDIVLKAWVTDHESDEASESLNVFPNRIEVGTLEPEQDKFVGMAIRCVNPQGDNVDLHLDATGYKVVNGKKVIASANFNIKCRKKSG